MTKNRTLLGFLLATTLAAPAALAQTAAPAPAPAPGAMTRPASRAAPVASTAPVKPQPSTPIPAGSKSAARAPAAAVLDAFIRPEVSNLGSADAKIQAEARTKLDEGLLTGVAGASPSPAFLQAYASTLSREVVALLRSPRAAANWRARLNAAIAVARVAERMESFTVDSSPLAPAVIAIADDKLSAVALWGLKAAKIVVPRQFDARAPVPPAQSVAAAVVRTMARFPHSEVIAEDGYEALAGGAVRTSNTRKLAALPHVLDLLRARTSVYAKVDVVNAAAPSDILDKLPGAPSLDDQYGLILLSLAWGPASKQQRQQATQVMVNLLKEVGRVAQSPVLPARPSGAPGVWKDDLIGILQQGGSVGNVVAGSDAKLADLKKAAGEVKKLTVTALPPAIDAAVTGLEAAYGAAGLLPAPTAAAPK